MGRNFIAIDFETATGKRTSICEVGISLKWHCSLKTARQIYNFSSNTLTSLCEQLNIPEGKHHRAGDDAEMCARLFLRELEDM